MTEVRWTSPAIDQLEAIIGRIFEDNPEAARATAQNIIDRVAQLGSFRAWEGRENAKRRANS